MKALGPREWSVNHYTDLATGWWWRSASSCTCFRRNNNKNVDGFFLVFVMENVTNRHFSKTAVSKPSNFILNIVLVTGSHVMWRKVRHKITIFRSQNYTADTWSQNTTILYNRRW
jgi:heterodisulfide reductase subunit C